MDEQGEHALQIGFNHESTIRITGKQVLGVLWRSWPFSPPQRGEGAEGG